VKLSCKEGIDWGKTIVYFTLAFEIRCKPLRDFYKHLFSDYGLELLLVVPVENK